MDKFRAVAENCHIYTMLKNSPKHISFHTPGHKFGKWDLTELAFSDNLSNPTGVIAEAERDISEITGGRSFILTDGSTCGVLSMIYASGAKKILAAKSSHKSLYNGVKLSGATLKRVENKLSYGIPQPLTLSQIERNIEGCDGVFITYPDYYGNLSDLKSIREICDRHGASLLVDAAHGSMFKGGELYAGRYADIWVDGVHKNLPCPTQGAVVSCREKFEKPLKEALDIFRSTSPNYLIMAGVEYAFKFPPDVKIRSLAEALKLRLGGYNNGDWSKIVIPFGGSAFEAEKFLESKGVYSEFCDGNYIMFYLSDCTKEKELKKLEKLLKACKAKFTYDKITENQPVRGVKTDLKREREEIPLSESVGRIAARACGIFPPCIPVLSEGDVITECVKNRLAAAPNTYGLNGNNIEVFR